MSTLELPTSLHALVDTSAALSPDGPGLHQVSAAFASDAATQPMLGRLEVFDTDLPLLRGSSAPLQVVLSGGAGQVAGPVELCARLGLTLAGIRLALRDYDDLASNVRRVAAAVEVVRASGALVEDVPVTVELPIVESGFGWTAAVAEAAAAELQVGFRIAGADQVAAPTEVATWIDAALDRETPFVVTRGVDLAVSSGRGHGLLNLVAAVQAAWDGAGQAAVVELLTEQDDVAVCSAAANATSARRWLTAASSAKFAELNEQVAALPAFSRGLGAL